MRGKSNGLSGDLTLRVTIRKRRMYRSYCAQLVKSVAGNSMISAQREVERCGQGQRKVEVSRPRNPGFVVYSRAGGDFLKGEEKPRDKSRLARTRSITTRRTVNLRGAQEKRRFLVFLSSPVAAQVTEAGRTLGQDNRFALKALAGCTCAAL
ncbi:hypothetical protein QC763_0094040 [Podospora pseudopauciseta]|uniref:Uncharacterized protein n=1 Tax=Podospora pseudopauciseta TaxID=2093780 RepID=A0ABR0H508_9PEZI|nr:hypothetical protein QC763_0094040 [Podospora pseudopauciseta]